MTQPPLRLLVSYHFHRKTDLAAMVESLGGGVDLFADSGAYSAYTTGAEIKLADYAAWVRDWQPLFTVASNLDVIGDHTATAANLHRLQEVGVDALPVFHVGEPWPVLEGLCTRHRYVALGGLAADAKNLGLQRQRMAWLVRAFQIARCHGTVFHCFGITGPGLIKDLPFYSVDSTSYRFSHRYAMVCLWDARKLAIRHLYYRHRKDVLSHTRLFTMYGLDPARVLDLAFLRAGSATADDDRNVIATATVRSYRSMEQALARRHQVASPELPCHATAGTKVYLAVAGSANSDLAPFRAVLSDAPGHRCAR